MLKQDKSYSFVKLDEEFIKKVFYNGGFGTNVNTIINKNEEKVTITNYYDYNFYLIENDFDVIDKLSQRKDENMTLGLRQGLVNTLPKDEAEEYINAIEEYEQEKITTQISNLRSFIEDEC